MGAAHLQNNLNLLWERTSSPRSVLRPLMSLQQRCPSIGFVSRVVHKSYCYRSCYGRSLTTVSSSLQSKDRFLDHREIGKRQELFMIHPYSPGSIFFLPHGTRIFNKLVAFMRSQQTAHGFNEVITPILYKKDLWIQSGHWDVYKDDMFRIAPDYHHHETKIDDTASSEDDAEYAIKPMNCPGHCLIFASTEKSYRELPIRISDFSPLHRNEVSGALTGLTRVRRFHQDDGHIFCMLDQIEPEIKSCLKMIDQVYSIFGLDSYKLLLSTRPDKFIGNVEDWHLAESSLKSVLQTSGKPWHVNDKDGAFYGPKIDIVVKDKMGKEHQTATIQLDFQLPVRFDLKFRSKDDSFNRPVMIHRAVFGSFERFLAILLESTQGKHPFWISPRQAMVIPVTPDKHGHYAKVVQSIMQYGNDNVKNGAGVSNMMNRPTFYVDIDERSEPLGGRIREAINKGYTFIAIVGDQEMGSNKVALRKASERNPILITPQDAYSMFSELERSYQ